MNEEQRKKYQFALDLFSAEQQEELNCMMGILNQAARRQSKD